VVIAGFGMAAIINDNRATKITNMDAHLIPPRTNVTFNPFMVDTYRSNLPTSDFVKNMRTDGNIDVVYNSNWTTYSN